MRAWFMKQVFIAGSDYEVWRKEGKADNDIVQAYLAHQAPQVHQGLVCQAGCFEGCKAP